jgi:hypothetical protein
VPGHAEADSRVTRTRGGEAGAPPARLAALPRARGAPYRRIRAEDTGGGEAAGQRRPAGRLLDGPDAVALPARNHSAARPGLADLRAGPADAGRVDPREPGADPGGRWIASRTARSRR